MQAQCRFVVYTWGGLLAARSGVEQRGAVLISGIEQKKTNRYLRTGRNINVLTELAEVYRARKSVEKTRPA